MINIVIESGGCCSDTFERKGEVAREALMWLFLSTSPPPASDHATVCVVAVPASPCPPFLRPAKAICSALCYSRGVTDKGEGVCPACTAEHQRPQSEWMLRAPEPLYPESLFDVLSSEEMETLYTQWQLQGKAG